MDPRLTLALSLAVTLFFVALDAKDEGFRASWWRDRRRAKRNAAFLLSNLVTMAALNACTRTLEGAVPPVFTWPAGGLGRIGEILACLLVAEGVNWASHWLKHRNDWLWRFHLQHHVETHYNVSLTLHTHGLEVLLSGCLMASLLVLCGFSRFSVDVFTLTYYAANLYKHCHARLSLGPLDAIVVSPAYHRLHHAKGHDGNFGSVLTVFDVLFGTATFPVGPDKDVAFTRPLGVTSAEPFGYVDEMLAPFLPRARITVAQPDEPPRPPWPLSPPPSTMSPSPLTFPASEPPAPAE